MLAVGRSLRLMSAGQSGLVDSKHICDSDGTPKSPAFACIFPAGGSGLAGSLPGRPGRNKIRSLTQAKPRDSRPPTQGFPANNFYGSGSGDSVTKADQLRFGVSIDGTVREPLEEI